MALSYKEWLFQGVSKINIFSGEYENFQSTEDKQANRVRIYKKRKNADSSTIDQ